jgi:EpsI family protein
MNSTATRVYIVVAIILVIYGGAHVAQLLAEKPDVEMPDWTFRELPLQLGNWSGEETTLDPTIAAATGAEVIVDRAYHDDSGRVIALHTAMFKDPAEGVYHSPMNCYRANGWRKLSEEHTEVPISENSTIAVDLTTWEKENEKVIVAYWYQVGEHVLYGRFELGTVRWALRGAAKWPALIKVMVQTPLTDPDDSRTSILEFTGHIAKWLNQPGHSAYLHGQQGI